MFNSAFGAAGANVVVPFLSRPRAAPAPKGWGQDEIAEAYRVIDLLARGGLAVHLVSGFSDEGDPWAAVLRDDNEDVVVHFARIGGRVILASAASEKVFSGPSLAAALRSVLETQPLVLPPAGGSLFLHPATILAAFIATALVNTVSKTGAAPVGGVSDSQARIAHEVATTGARQGDSGYSPALVAAAIASVATAFSLTMDEVSLYSEEPLLELSAIQTQIERSFDRHFTSDQLGWDRVLDAQIGVVRHGVGGLGAWLGPRSAEVPVEDAAPPALDDALKAFWAHADIPVKLDDGSWRVFHDREETAAVADQIEVGQAGIPVSATLTPEPTPAQEPLVAEGKAAASTASLHANFIQADGENFYWEVRFLLGLVGSDEVSAFGTARVTTEANPEPHTLENDQSRPSTAEASLFTVARDVAPDLKATIFMDFTLDHAKELAADPEVLGQVMAALRALPFQADVDRVVIFEADDVTVDVFIMSKGVAMVRGDMLDAVLHPLALSQQVAFEMTNGEYFKLLGVIEV